MRDSSPYELEFAKLSEEHIDLALWVRSDFWLCKHPRMKWGREVRIHKERKWRADFVIFDKKILVEIDGGVWSGGRHLRPKGFAGDAEKLNYAVALGWRVFRFPRGKVDFDLLERVIDRDRKLVFERYDEARHRELVMKRYKNQHKNIAV